ncbi:glycosyltransferase [Paractinoplanes globisporus]|uniref:Glycosyltransferase n=1 Tax=Paractinoplanes globisporus TaxID=113565 RepID=A0ABW6WFP4_9ACTN|nr:glycosyltransferase [Actinoplanes globisporus]
MADEDRTRLLVGGPRRILHVINLGTLAGGAERQLADLVGQQRAAGHEVRVLSSDLNGAGAWYSDITWKQPRRTGLLARLAGQLTNSAARETLARVVEGWQPEVVHLHTVGLLSPAALDVLAGTPTVLTVHGPEVYVRGTERWCLPDHYFRTTAGRSRRLTWRGRAAMLLTTGLVGRRWRQRLRVVDVFLAPSRFLADQVARGLGPTRVVPNGRAATTTASERDTRTTRSGRPSRLLFVGRLEYFKGVEIAIDALSMVARKHPGVTMTIVGSGPVEERLRQQVAEHGLGGRVELAGWLDPGGVEQQLAAADVAIVPSLCPEAFGLVCLEAFAAGTPVIASAVGGLPEIVHHEKTGLLVPPGDAAGLAAAIDRMFSDHGLRQRLAEAGAGLVDEFSLEAHACAVGDGYREAIDRHRSRTGSPARSVVHTLTERWRSVLADSLLRNSALLLLAMFQLAGGGFLFWQLVAHLFSPAEVGRASAAISATTLIANLALLGMNNAAIRYLPRTPDPRRVVNTGLSVVAGAALVGAGCYALLHVGMPGVAGSGRTVQGPALITLTTLGAVSLFYDNVFVALRRSGHVLARNTVVVAARLIAPLFLVCLGALGIFVAYWAAAAVALPVYLVALCRMGLAPRLTASRGRLREMWRYAAGNYLATAILITPGLLMPVLVAARLGPVNAAYYYIASLVASVLLFVPQALCRSLFAELAHDPADARRYVTRVLRLAAVTQIPLLAAMVLLGRPLLGLFGGPYTQGYPLLVLVASTTALSSVGYVGSTLLLAGGQIRLLCLLSAGAYGPGVVAAFLLADRSVTAVGAAMLAGEALLALGYLPILARTLRDTENAP